ncbi:MAG: M1 family peptidase [Chitinophagaceae bacterium]|nr:MAG: M1 family peptidase [Chitinophagaceae bacterium]
MKKLLLALALLPASGLFAQNADTAAYWQQAVHYRINVSLDDREHGLRGNSEMTYVNHSPDALPFIWIHLWPNAFRDNNSAFARMLLRTAKGKAQLRAIKDKGYIDSLAFTVNGVAAVTEPHPEWTDVVKLVLPTPLKSGDSVTIQTPFHTKLPTYTSRSGHIGQSYMACQWYPKAAVYDRKGWHPMPYLDMGEYYNDYGNYEVRITLPGEYVVGATGVLQTEDERRKYIDLGTRNRTGRDKPYVASAAEKTLHYSAQRVSDFAWFADKKFLVEYDTLQLAPGARPVDVFAFHHGNAVPAWQQSTDFIKSAVRFYSTQLGNYVYPTVQAVEGPNNESSGGMEYPMITLINMPEAKDVELDVVITHEVGHNWFPMMVGANERAFTWMDEGFNTYYENLYAAEKYSTNLMFGEALPSYVRTGGTDNLLQAVYQALNRMPTTQPINTPADEFKSEDEYGLVSYQKTATLLYIFEVVLGKAQFRAAMRRYFDEWKFRHPYPEDFRASLERSLQRDLSDLFAGFDVKGPFKE